LTRAVVATGVTTGTVNKIKLFFKTEESPP